ncbi:MAG: hypothetical protein J0H67_21055 [Rhodospirillales bacterium]|nr:hypothetical protein [Rhodospirillales bacterium]
MIRYVLAGMATVAGLVLLFLGSFGSQPARDTGAAGNGNPPYAMLQSQVRDAAETMESLRKQLAAAREDLASLQERKTDAAPPDAAPSAPAAPSPAAPSPSVTAAQNDTPGHGATPAPAAAPRSEATAAARAAPADAPRPQQQASRTAEPTQPFGFGPRARTETRPEAGARPIQEATVSREAPSPSEAEGVIERLRREASTPGPASRGPVPLPAPIPLQVPPVQASPSAPAFSGQAPQVATTGRHRIPTRERLADARLAVQEGRIEDARRYLQAAQVQLVFQPTHANDVPPRASFAAGPVGQALTALGYGDRGRALVAIDQALGVINAAASADSAPGQQANAGAVWPPLPVPRSWP